MAIEKLIPNYFIENKKNIDLDRIPKREEIKQLVTNINKGLEVSICKKLLPYKRFFILSNDFTGVYYLRANTSDRTILLRVSFDDGTVIDYN